MTRPFWHLADLLSRMTKILCMQRIFFFFTHLRYERYIFLCTQRGTNNSCLSNGFCFISSYLNTYLFHLTYILMQASYPPTSSASCSAALDSIYYFKLLIRKVATKNAKTGLLWKEDNSTCKRCYKSINSPLLRRMRKLYCRLRHWLPMYKLVFYKI